MYYYLYILSRKKHQMIYFRYILNDYTNSQKDMFYIKKLPGSWFFNITLIKLLQCPLKTWPQWMNTFIKSENIGPYTKIILEDFNVIQKVNQSN
jgi:hypothetical protein